MKFLAFLGFSKKFRLKRYFEEICPHFGDAYCSSLREFLNDNSQNVIIYHAFSSNYSL